MKNLPPPVPTVDLRRTPLGMHPCEDCARRVNEARVHAGAAPALVFDGNRFRCLVSIDATHSGVRLHASISHVKRYPTWGEIKAVREWIFPDDMEVVMVLPRVDDYVNLSPNCFHLWQSACQNESG